MDTDPTRDTLAADRPPVSRVGRVIEALRVRIDSRALGQGAKLPSVRRLAEQLDVSTSTVVEAYDRLAAEGLVEARRGSGFYVAAPPPPLVLARAPSLDPAADLLTIIRNALEARPDVLQPGAGWLPESWLPAAGVEKAIRATARGGGPTKLRYDSPRGFEPLRRLIAARLADRGARVDPAQIVLLDSTTQALDLAARFFLSPGDCVVIDDPRYFSLVHLLGAHRAKIVGAPFTREGPDVDALEAIFAEHRPRLYITVAGPHNPTGASLSPAVAHRVLMLAERYGVTIVEDDIYGAEPAARDLRRLRSRHPGGRLLKDRDGGAQGRLSHRKAGLERGDRRSEAGDDAWQFRVRRRGPTSFPARGRISPPSRGLAAAAGGGDRGRL